MKHVNIKIFGDVQGVLFGYSSLLKAKEFNIKGFVRNEPDGTVYIEVEGEEENLDKFTQWCRSGPQSATVKKVEEAEGELKNFESFITL